MPRPAGIDSSNTPASKARISLRADIDKLMEYFLLTESVRYQEFARVWQAFNFALIYAGLKDTKEKKDFIQDAFELVSEFLQPPFDLQRRVCALYILYGLYYTQTHHPRIKIRMSLEDWKETLALHDDLQEQGHLDALFIFHKMRLDKAFMFTASHTQLFYQMRSKKPEDFEKWAAKHQGFMASVLDEDLLQELEQVHKGYQDDKQQQNLQDDPSMAMVQDSMSEFVMERITNIDVPQQAEEPKALAESRSCAQRLREIKKRSFSSPTKSSKARRSALSSMDESETDDDTTYNPTVGRLRGRGRPRVERNRKGRPRGRPKKSESNSSPSGRKRQASADTGESDRSPSTPRKKKRKDTLSDGSPAGKKKQKCTKRVSDKSKSNETLEPVSEADETADEELAEGSAKKKKAKKSKDGRKHIRKTKSSSKGDDVGESSKTKDSKKTSPESSKTKDSKKTSPESSKTKDSKKTSPESSKTKDSKKTSPESSKTKDSKKTSPESSKTKDSKKTSPESSKTKDSKKRSPEDKQKGSKGASKTKDKDSKSKRGKKSPTNKESSPKSPSNDSEKESKDVAKVKTETPSGKESEAVKDSPRKRPRKSTTPRRITRSQDNSNT